MLGHRVWVTEQRLPGTQWQRWGWNPGVLRFSCIVLSIIACTPKRYAWGRLSRGTSLEQQSNTSVNTENHSSSPAHRPHLPWGSHPCSHALLILVGSGVRARKNGPNPARCRVPAACRQGGWCWVILGVKPGQLAPAREDVAPGTQHCIGYSQCKQSGPWMEHNHLWIYYSFSNAN